MIKLSTLYFFFSTRCEHCHEAVPHLNTYQREHGYRSIMIVRLNIDLRDWYVQGWTPRNTPGYALVVDGKLVRKQEGVMTSAPLRDWIGAPQ